MSEMKKIYVAPGDTVFIRLGCTELCMSMRLVGKVMPVRVLDHREGYGQLLDPQGQCYSMPNPLSWMNFYQDAEGWFSTEILATNVAYDVTATVGTFCRFVDGRRTFGGTRNFEESRDWILADRAKNLEAELRWVEDTHVEGYPAWVQSTPIPLDADVHEEFSAWGGNHSRAEDAIVSREVANLPSVHEAWRAAMALAKRYGYGRVFRDTYLSLPTHPRLPAGRSVLREV